MIDVGAKPVTRRECLACGTFRAKASTIEAIRTGTLPKGDVLPLAEAAAIMAVKNTGNLLPLCHPLPVDSAGASFEFEELSITVYCRVLAHAKTGVEMEALSGVTAALLCIYDLAKGIDPDLEIGSIHLLEKSGGKSGHWKRNASEPDRTEKIRNPEWQDVRAAVITLSDRCARGESEDRSGPALMEYLSSLGARNPSSSLLPDDAAALRSAVLQFVESGFDLILTTGGTGVGPRDITPETLEALSGKLIPGFGERIRAEGCLKTPLSPLSRAEAYLIGGSLVISLPGSPKGAIESMDAIRHLIPHTLRIQKGGSHP
jgi:cyclic pyranopterin phosphate synthase